MNDLFSARPKRGAIAVALIILLNTLVFAAWHIPSAGEDGPPFMIDNFLVSWTALAAGRFWILLTSEFSHNMFWHLLMNMYVLSSFGGIMEKIMGPWRFLKFYLVAAIIASLGHAAISEWILNEPDLPALGASGAISGVVLLFSMIFPKQKILILGLIPIPAVFGALLFIGLDLWGLIAQAEGGGLPIGHGAHLGGAFTGIIYYFIFVRPRIVRSRIFANRLCL